MVNGTYEGCEDDKQKGTVVSKSDAIANIYVPG
jgi:hypothetical protein